MLPKVSIMLFLVTIIVALSCFTSSSLAKSITSPVGERERVLYPSEADPVPDEDASLDNALINYLFARQMSQRLRNNMDVQDLQRKRSYWKQCAFNAVTCFGRRKRK